MNTKYIIEELKRNKIVFKELLENLDQEVYLWKPLPEKWNLLEVLCHLHDEEREDFRARVKHTLEHPELPLTPIDPAGWVTERKYAGQDYDAALEIFLTERDNSVEWLNTLNDPKWDNTHKHPKLGDLTAGMFFTSWLAHDYLHIKQITKIKYDYFKEMSGDKISYAGEWK
ncbi:MAG TPA: DinB family protein [Chitinophagaceae bacterium]|nr:DinB family protein [Chitinophagaceae bacterium]